MVTTFDQNVLHEVDSIFERADLQGRTVLFEFEVYDILNRVGIQTPEYLFLAGPDGATEESLSKFGKDLVVKIVSPQIVHKEKVDGVKIIKNWDLTGLKDALKDMEREVLSHFPQDERPAIQGFLLVEYIPYIPSLGNETMIGCREDSEFGPVVLISKGGSDAEFFAKYYDPANIHLPPLNREASLDFVSKLNVANKFRKMGKEADLDRMADALTRVSHLAYFYSSISPQKPRYNVQTLDINPLVITGDGRFIAIDGFCAFSAADQKSERRPQGNPEHLEMFFRPRSVSVIGVSADLSKPNMAREIAILLHKMGHRDLYLVNPRGGTMAIEGAEYPLFKNFQDIPKVIDLVVYVAPIASTAQFVKDLGGRAKAVIVISGLPANLKYSDFVAQMDEVKPKELRLIGPNCMGVFLAPGEDNTGVNTLFIEEEKLGLKYSEHSNTALLTQSGALALTSIDAMQNSKVFKAIVSFGNQYDVKITDLMAFFANDPSIELISLYVEGLSPGEGRLFFELVRESQKPILVYKSGKTAAGAQAAASHTAAISGNYEIFRAATKQGGVILAETLEEYYDYLRIFSLLAKKKPQGNRVAGVVNAGFESTIAADELDNLVPATLHSETIQKLRQADVHGLVDLSTALLDVTPMANDQLFTDYVETVLQDENVDCVFVSIVPHSNALKSGPDTARDPGSLASLLARLAQQYQKPLVVSVNGARHYDEFVAVMEEGGLPVYRNPRAAVQALEAFVSYHLNQK
mgnify:CR=1 FL=1